MKHTFIFWLQTLATLFLVIVFLINIVELVELYILCKPKEKCWWKFGSVMMIIGILYFIFYSFIWKKCIHVVQRYIYNNLAFMKKMPFLL